MIEIGLDLPPGIFKEAAQYGFVLYEIISMTYLLMCVRCSFDRSHVLAPSSTDLVKYGQNGTIVTRRHSDVNFLTIHGRSRYPSLDIWARNSKQRIGVEIPPGNNFVVQAGKQLEHITGGLIKAGFHEVVVNDQTLTVSDSDANILLCAHLAFFIMIRLLNDGRWNSQTDLLFESHQPFSGTCHKVTIWFLSPR
jgi:isopenicillin N synthase-like dioxygenase